MFVSDFSIAGHSVTLTGLLVTLVGLIILWIIVSIPVWLAGKAVTGGKGSFGDALLATLAGPIVYFIVLFLVSFFLSAAIGSTVAFIFAYLLALLAWIWVYKASFHTGWLQGIAIAILAWVIFIILSIVVSALFGIMYPAPFFPKI